MSVTTQQISSRINSVVMELFPSFQGTISKTLRVKEDLGADSMTMISLMIALDAEFDVEFDPSLLPSEALTLGWIEDFIASKTIQDS